MLSEDELLADKRYQIVIPVHPKDYTKLPFVIERALRYTDASAIHLMAYETEDIHKYIPSDSRVFLHHECNILPEPREIFPDIRQGQGWYFQQFLELFQDVTDTDWYIGLNCDLMMNRRYPVFASGKPMQVLSRDKNSQKDVYNPFNLAMFPGSHVSPWNYLSDGTLYNKKITREMAGGDVAGFMHKSAELIRIDGKPRYTPGDANLYMHYVNNVYPYLYFVVELRNAMNGKYNGETWTTEELEALLSRNSDADTISAHCWGNIK